MKRHLILGAMAIALSGPAWAMEHGMSHEGMDHGSMDHGERKGEKIHTSTVDGNRLTYYLIDNVAAMAEMEGMEGHDMSQMKSHHLMLYIEGEDGQKIADAKVGYVVKGPDGSEQKTMAMGMTGGFGADVELRKEGTYTIKAKAVAGERKLLDEFRYRVE